MSHPFLSSFDGSGTPQGAFTSSTRGGLAIDQTTGDIVITEADLFRLTPPDAPLRFGLNIYDSTGTFVLQIDEGDLPSSVRAAIDPHLGIGARAVAIDSSGGAYSGDIYVALGDLVLVFDSAGTYVRKLDGSNTPDGSFVSPQGLIVDSEGNVYVADTGTINSGTLYHHVIDKFNSEGNYVSQISGSHVDGNTSHLAIDSAGNLYAVNQGDGVAKFNSAGAFQYVLGTDQASKVAVDPATDDLYVAEGPYIAQYDSTGNLIGSFGSSEIGERIGGLGVRGSSGNVYAIDVPGGNTPFHVDVFGPTEVVTTPDVVSIEPTDEISYFSATFHGVVNPQGVPSSYHFEYRRSGQSFDAWKSTPEQSVGSGSEDVAVNASVDDLQKEGFGQLADGKSYEVRLIATNTDADASAFSTGTDTFSALAVPLAGTSLDQPTTFTATTAHLSGTITNPSPGFDTSYLFQYSADGINWQDGPQGSAGSSPGEIAVEGDIAGLVPNSEYFVRLRASNPGGGATSSAVSFTTAAAPPSQVETIPPGLVEETSARLGGWVNPNHSPTKYWFEYGPAECASNPCASFPASENADAGSGVSASVFTEDISGLEPATTYHYRIVAQNSAGTAAGNDIVFTTDDPDAPGPPDRGFELVNPPDKGNQPVVAGPLSTGAEVLWQVDTGVAGSSSGVQSIFKASRSPSGWQSQSLLPPVNELVGGGVEEYTLASVNLAGSRYFFRVDYFAFGPGLPEYALIDLEDGTQQLLGQVGDDRGFETLPVMFSDRVVKQAYASTYLPFSVSDEDGQFDIYSYDQGTASWSLASRRPDESDPACKAIPAGSAGELAPYPETSDGGNGEKRIFFVTTPTDNCGEPNQLYMRDLVNGATTAMSTPALSGSLQEAFFIRASSDGSSVLFKTKTVLAPEDENVGADLYMWREGSGNECITCVVADAEVDQAMAGPDLSYAYFSSQERLVGDRGLSMGASQRLLYAIHDEEIAYIGPVGSDPDLGEAKRSVDTSHDGSILLFRSQEEKAEGVTADTPQGGNGTIYWYDADRDELQCVSCSPDAAGQLSFNLTSEISGGSYHAIDAPGSAIVFGTSKAILPRDVNQGPDIYEWRNSKVRLITDGVTEFPESFGQLALSGISSDGANVLFTVGEQLTGHELDHTSNVYVARAGGGFPPLPQPPAPCQEDSCQGPLATPPPAEDISSASFVGPGNASAPPRRGCRRGQRKVRRQGRVRCTGKLRQRTGKGRQGGKRRGRQK